MSNDVINAVGICVLAAFVWYVHIYLPRKKRTAPGELKVKSVMDNKECGLYQAINNTFGRDYIIKNNVCLDDVIYSPSLDKKQHFRKYLRGQSVMYLIIDYQLSPVLAVTFTEPDDDVKLQYLANAGIGCCIFDRGTSAELIEKELKSVPTLNAKPNKVAPVTHTSVELG